MKASPLSELYTKDSQLFFMSKKGEKYFIEISWLDRLEIHWNMLSMSGVVGATMTFADHLSFNESIPLEKGISFEMSLADTSKNKFKYVFVITDIKVETVNKTRKNISLAMMDPYSFNMIKTFHSKGYNQKRTDEIINDMCLLDEDIKLYDKINGVHEWNSGVTTLPTGKYCKTYSYVTSGKKSSFRNIKEKCYEEGILAYTDREARKYVFLNDMFKDKEPRTDIYHQVAGNDDYIYKIDEIKKVPPGNIDLLDPALKKEWFSPWYGAPQTVDIDLPKYELDFEYKKKISKVIDYHGQIGQNATRLNDVSPEGRIIHSYLSKALQRNQILILIYGDFTLNLGELIETQIYSTGGKIDEIDQEVSGVWMVTEIVDAIHPPSFYQVVTLSRPRIMKKDHAPIKPK
jgi:hypothetical protein